MVDDAAKPLPLTVTCVPIGPLDGVSVIVGEEEANAACVTNNMLNTITIKGKANDSVLPIL